MPEVLGNPPSPRAVLFWNGTAWQWALVDAAGHLQIDVQTILGLEGALQSVATDRLQVRGEDQLFSIEQTINLRWTGAISGAGGSFTSGVIPPGQYWVVTNVTTRDATSPTTEIRLCVWDGVLPQFFHAELRAFVALEFCHWNGHVYVPAGNYLRAYYIGALAGDLCELYVHAYQMTVEV